MRHAIWLGAVVVLSMYGGAGATSVSYDASNGLPSTPNFSLIDFVGASKSAAGGTLSMGPTAKGALSYTFYANTNQVLDHTKTIEITATARALSSDSDNVLDRAGFALSLTDDRNFYNELYISPTEVFLNKLSGSTRVRDVAMTLPDTNFHDYKMDVTNGVIDVYVDGIHQFTGAMFDTATLGGIPTGPNWAVFGDITSSAGGTFELKTFSVSVVPEPALAVAPAVLLALGCMSRGRRRQVS